MKYLFIGGRADGTWREVKDSPCNEPVRDGLQTDLYARRKFAWVQRRPGGIMERIIWRVYVSESYRPRRARRALSQRANKIYLLLRDSPEDAAKPLTEIQMIPRFSKGLG